MREIRVGERLVGPGRPCFVAAEVGINHNGDLALAHRLIDAAADAGADGVKFQNYRTEDFLSDETLTYEYVSQGRRVVESQFAMFKRCELSTPALRELREHCDERGVVFFSTPTSEQGVEDVVAAGAPLLKNGSDYLVNLDLVKAMARTGLPTVISTGMATVEEIRDAVEAFRGAGGSSLLLLHCTSSYPTPPEDAHLLKIPALAELFDCPVGLSDHTEGAVAAPVAVALGACFVEKHFTLDRGLPGPDHRFSSDPEELAALAAGVRFAERALGSAELGPTPSEALGRQAFRLSCVAARDLPPGHRLAGEDIAFRRPGTGLPPKERDRLVGRELVDAVPAGHVFSPEDVR